MKKILFLLPLLINALTYSERRIILEAPIINSIDGTFINADKLEFMIRFGRKLVDFMFGELQSDDTHRKGKYNLFGEFQTVESLARIEQEVKHSSDPKDIEIQGALQELLQQAKTDFIVLTSKFIVSNAYTKNIMIVAIQEDCQQRNRFDSLLLEWANTKEGQESIMFEKNITSFTDYYGFLIDLANFLLDVVHSCPKAEAQFKNRIIKRDAVKVLLPVILKKAHVKEEQVNEGEFLRYLKERYFDSLAMNEITPEIIAPLLVEHIKKHTYACNN